MPALLSGYCRCSRRGDGGQLGRPPAPVSTPGAGGPTTDSRRTLRALALSWFCSRGTHSSAPASRKWKPGGMTPTTVAGLPLSERVLPERPRDRRRSAAATARGSGSRPARRPGRSSSGRKARPRAGPHAQQVEQVGRDVEARRSARPAPAPVSTKLQSGEAAASPCEGSGLDAQVAESRRRRPAAPGMLSRLLVPSSVDEALGVRVGQRAQQHRVDDAEERACSPRCPGPGCRPRAR